MVSPVWESGARAQCRRRCTRAERVRPCPAAYVTAICGCGEKEPSGADGAVAEGDALLGIDGQAVHAGSRVPSPWCEADREMLDGYRIGRLVEERELPAAPSMRPQRQRSR